MCEFVCMSGRWDEGSVGLRRRGQWVSIDRRHPPDPRVLGTRSALPLSSSSKPCLFAQEEQLHHLHVLSERTSLSGCRSDLLRSPPPPPFSYPDQKLTATTHASPIWSYILWTHRQVTPWRFLSHPFVVPLINIPESIEDFLVSEDFRLQFA